MSNICVCVIPCKNMYKYYITHTYISYICVHHCLINNKHFEILYFNCHNPVSLIHEVIIPASSLAFLHKMQSSLNAGKGDMTYIQSQNSYFLILKKSMTPECLQTTAKIV